MKKAASNSQDKMASKAKASLAAKPKAPNKATSGVSSKPLTKGKFGKAC